MGTPMVPMVPMTPGGCTGNPGGVPVAGGLTQDQAAALSRIEPEDVRSDLVHRTDRPQAAQRQHGVGPGGDNDTDRLGHPGIGDLAFDLVYGTDLMHRFVYHTRGSFFHVGRERRDDLVREYGRLDPLIGGIARAEMRTVATRMPRASSPGAWPQAQAGTRCGRSSPASP